MEDESMIGIKPNLPAYESFGVAEYLALSAAVVGAGTSAYSIATQKKPVMPPSPVMGAAQQDQSTEAAESNAMRRESIAGGLNSTIGAGGGMMNPGNTSGHTLLGQ
jgi:hypothetical protein